MHQISFLGIPFKCLCLTMKDVCTGIGEDLIFESILCNDAWRESVFDQRVT